MRFGRFFAAADERIRPALVGNGQGQREQKQKGRYQLFHGFLQFTGLGDGCFLTGICRFSAEINGAGCSSRMAHLPLSSRAVTV
jgi:hypothetical protein